MLPFRSVVCRTLLLVAFLLVSFSPTAALAKKRGGLNDKILEVDTSKSYSLPYALVILGAALGVMIVARPGTRLDAPRRRKIDEEDDE